MLNLAVVGTSAITEKCLDACRASGRFRFVTLYSRSYEKGAAFARKQGFLKTSQDLPAIARDPEIHAVYIASPNALHYDQSKLFLEHGKHVLCEKPITTCTEEFLELSTLAKAKGLVYLEAMKSRHSSGRKALKDALGQIGRISQARLNFCQRSSRYDQVMAGEQVNIFDMSLAAGALMDLGVYCVAAAADLFGQPEDIQASAVYLPNGADCAGTVIFRYPEFLASLTYSKAGQSVMPSEIVGDQGVIIVDSVSQFVGVHLWKDGVDHDLTGALTGPEVMRQELDAFADFVEHPDSFAEAYAEATCKAALTHRCMDAIKESAGIVYPR